MLKQLPLFASLLLSSIPMLGADPVAEARVAINAQDFASAHKILDPLFRQTSSSRLSGEANYLMGLCEFEMGDYQAARPLFETARAKGFPEAALYLGRLAYLDYDLDSAEELFDAFDACKRKSNQDQERAGVFRRQLEEGRNALSHVRDLKIIDKRQIPAVDFWKHIPLPSSAGAFLPPDSIPFAKGREEAMVAFTNEGRDYMLWSEADSIGRFRLVESLRLLGGGWSEPKELSDELTLGDETDYPFMRPDGTTLYFASSGEGSIGGMDLFVATRDSRTGEYLRPLNLGIPFNSPYDDLLLSVDEENGIGWLVSDREQLPDRLTLYMFAFEEERSNIDEDAEDLIDRARITDSQVLADENPVKIEKLRLLKEIKEGGRHSSSAFRFRMPNGNIVTSINDIPVASRKLAEEYIGLVEEQEREERKLSELRRSYHSGRDSATASAIRRLESSIESRRLQILTQGNRLVSSLKEK